MRMQDLTITHAQASIGIYAPIQTRDDFDRFFRLCKKYHPNCYEFDHGDYWAPSITNIRRHSVTQCYAYISGISGVVGCFAVKDLQSLVGYQKLSTTKEALHLMVKNYKE